MDFLESEVRYTSLRQSFPEEAEELFKAAEGCIRKIRKYKKWQKINI